jgi:subtilase family serine protease
MEPLMQSWKLFLLPVLASTLCLAASPDRITGPIDSSQRIALKGNMHSLAQPRFDIGRADGSRMMTGVTLVFRPSAAQQQSLNNLLAQQQDRSSPNYHKWLTPAQFADRFAMTRADIHRIVAWLESRGFSVTSVANSRTQLSFDGTVAQIESEFSTEIHNYLVNGEVHLANSTNPSVPVALAESVLAIGHLHNFSPKPRAIIRKMSSGVADSHFTSYISGNHFLAPGDFATIYDIQPLYSAGIDGTGQTIAVVGQSTVSATDLSNFRNAAGLAARAPQYILSPSSSTPTRCTGDEGESDLDLEWSGGVAQNATIIFVYAGLSAGDSCSNRFNSVWDALQQTVDNNYAPVISTSYGSCETSNGEAFAETVQQWAVEANSQGQTIVAASGDSGAADCDSDSTDSASGGLAVDVPAAIPQVTGMGGTEFDGDAEATVSGGNASTTTYWTGTTGSTDTISSALSYIPEMGWNDTAENHALSASGGGASIYFTKPSWQTGTGVPADGKRDVPDLALNASPNHDPYLFCSEDGENGAIQTTCTSGFRDGSGGTLAAVGGTSCAAPTFSAIVALLNEDLGLTGLGNVNPTLYSLAASSPAAFHDVTVGNNIVPCTSGTPDCPSGTVQYGFTAGVGYDQVTGLGSVVANTLAAAWKATLTPDFALSASTLSPASVPAGQSASSTLTISPVSGSTGMVVNFSNTTSCSGLPAGSSCSFNPISVTFDGTNPITTTLTISTAPNIAASGPTTITITPTNSSNTTTTVSLTVVVTTETMTLTTTATTFAAAVGATAQVPITVSGSNGFIVGSGSGATTALPVTYTCSGSPNLATAEISCQFSPTNGQSVSQTAVTLNLVTTAPTSQLRPPMGRSSQIFYAMLLPGLFGIVFAAGGRKRGLRLLSLMMVLGFSTLWLGACGGSGGGTTTLPNPGTPAQTYSITVSATTGGANPITSTLPFTLNVTQ